MPRLDIGVDVGGEKVARLLYVDAIVLLGRVNASYRWHWMF
jgi:hypothetical protein